MRKTFLFVIAAFFALSMNAQRTFAVLTGVSNYEGEVNDLQQSTKDVKHMSVLYKSKKAQVTTLTSAYATRENVISTLQKIAKVANANDHIVFYYSGHGVPNSLCTYTTQGSPMLTYNELFNELDKCKAKDIVVYIDACHSGTAASAIKQKGNTDEKSWQTVIKANPRYILFLSSRDDETSLESPFVGAGYFTRALLKGLRGKSDTNSDRNVTVIELFQYIYKDVQLHSNKEQHPQLVTSKTLHNNVLMSW